MGNEDCHNCITEVSWDMMHMMVDLDHVIYSRSPGSPGCSTNDSVLSH